MNKSKYVLNAFKELVDKRETRNEDYEAILEGVVNHYDKVLVGNLFIDFVGGIDNVREVSTAGKTIIEIPIRENRYNHCFRKVMDKWKELFKGNFHLDLTEVEFWKVNEAGNGITRTHAYSVTFRRFPWIAHLEDEVSKISDKDTKEFVYNEQIKKELEDKVCSCIKAQVMIEVDEFLVELSKHIEGVMKYGIRIKTYLTDDGVTKPTLVQEESGNGYTVFVPYCIYDEYIDLIKNTLGFHQSVYDSNVFFPNPGIMAGLI